MATKTFEELRTLAIQVRDENISKANSALRIGNLMLEQIDKIEESYNRIPEEELSELDKKIDSVSKGSNYEILIFDTDIRTTRLQVLDMNRKAGYMITYNPGSGWIKEQYIGKLTDNEEWIKDENWKAEVLDENIQAIAENAQQQANFAAINAALAQEKANEASMQAAYAKEQGDAAATRGVGKIDIESDGTGEVFNDYYGNKALGPYSHAEGAYTIAEQYCHAEGYGTTAKGTMSHVEGAGILVGGKAGASIENSIIVASGPGSHAEGYGYGTVYGVIHASGPGSHAEGYSYYGTIKASGKGSHAEGLTYYEEMEAKGYGSHIQNVSTSALTYAQTAIGCRNTPEDAPSPSSYDATKAAFIIGNGSGNSNGNAFKVLFNGQTFADGQYSSSGADYAEMFEWKDGNPLNEDRVGRFVTLKGKNIELANESSNYILGVVSGAPTIIGDDPMRWQGKYLNDEWGRPLYEDVERVFVRNIKKNDGTIETVEEVKKQHVRKINPNYDPMERYIPRIERPEWDYVGMMGKLLVRQDGTLTEGGFCKPGANGVATIADSGYYVMEIINENQALILFR